MGNSASQARKDEENADRLAKEALQAQQDEAAADAEIIKITGSIGPGVIAHASKSRRGKVPYNKHKVNQDRGFMYYGLQGDPALAMWGICDGHGEHGHFVSSFLQEKMPECMAAQGELKNLPEKSMTEAVRRACEDLVETNINVSFSGSTCVFGVRVADMLYVANVGDSRAVLCRQADNGELQAIGLSVDQKPDNPKERLRILKAGGRVEPLPGPPGEDCGPPRVWLAEVDVPGLAMARSIGDEVAQTVGVISVPEIIPHQVQSNDIFALFASDGVWEFLSNEQAVSIVWKYKHDLAQAADMLVEEAHKQWRKEEEVVDDATVIIVMFNQPK